MEDGDVIDALLQQACAHLVSYCLRSSSHLFRSEVAHIFAHDLSIFDLASHVDFRHRQCFSSCVCTYQSLYLLPKIILCLILPLNQQHRESRRGAVLSTPSDADVR